MSWAARQSALWLVGIALLFPAIAMSQDNATLARARSAIDSLELDEARVVLDSLKGTPTPRQRQLEALLLFHEGAYGAAEEQMRLLAEQLKPLPPYAQDLTSWIQSARELRAGMQNIQSPDGRYQVWFEPGDALLGSYALDVLKRADQALTKIFGKPVRGPIRLEIYPDSRALAQVSSLTVEHIQTTGTIALSKWNRLMVTSPRALLRGYPWMDTIGHEFVHLVLAEHSKNKAPVWVHEGMAKLLERSWRGEAPSPALSPASRASLIKAAKEKTLIPFEKLHPSIAMLPSQDSAALAFAQVSTFIQTLHARRGDAGVQELTALMASGQDARRAVGQVWGAGFDDLERTWKRKQASLPTPKRPPSLIKMRFQSEDEGQDESLDVAEERARRHVRLGDMLWTRGRKKAASREYQRGHRYAPEDAVLASRLGRTALESGEAARAIAPLRKAITRQPAYAPLRSLLGEAALAVGDQATARTHLQEAIRLNPFDPSPHCGLSRLSGEGHDPGLEGAICRHLKDGSALPPVQAASR